MTGDMDFPQAWEFTRSTAPEHHSPKCSWITGKMLCDCSVLWCEYYKRQLAQRTPATAPAPQRMCGHQVYVGTTGESSCELPVGHAGRKHRQGKFEWYDNEEQPAPAPQSTEDVVERMLKAYWQDTIGVDVSDATSRMTAALAVARKGYHSEAEIHAAIHEEVTAYRHVNYLLQDVAGEVLAARVLARLAAKEKL